MKIILCLFLAFSQPVILVAQQAATDTVQVLPVVTTPNTEPTPARPIKLLRGYILPVALIGIGLYTTSEHSLYSRFDASQDAKEAFPKFSTTIDDYLFFLPIAGLYGFNAFSSQNRHNTGRQTVLLISSAALASSIMIPLKHITNIDRPNGQPHAFPSGHTTYAFVIASVFDREFRDKSKWLSVGGYTVASATGVMRVLNNEHWLSDVLAGAGIGLLSVHTVYYIHDHYIKNKKNISLYPFMHYGATGLGFNMVF